MTSSPPAYVRLLLKLALLLGVFPLLARWIFGQRIAAVMGLTWKAALRFRLFLVIAVLLLASVVGLPMLIEDDGTARGFTQILLTYTLSVITALLGLSTLWLACGTLARDIEECQMQMLAVKPIARWQIWLGKWLGIVTLNAALLAISGASVYALLLYRAQQLPPEQQAVLHNEVLVARASARERSYDREIEQEAQRILQETLQRTPVTALDLPLLKRQILEQVRAQFQIVAPGAYRPWQIELGFTRHYLRDQPLFLRVKFNTANYNPSGTFGAVWQVGNPDTGRVWRSELMSLAPETFHEFEIPPNLYDENGVLTIIVMNPNDTALLFPLDEGMEVLYREGGFGLNFARGLGIIFCWMALLAALGLASASCLSFPVAAFVSLSILTMALSSGTMATAVSEGTLMGTNHETGASASTIADKLLLPVFQGVLTVINLAKDFSPIDALSTGRSITWAQLAQAVGQIVLLLGGIIGGAGIVIFTRRELATAQGNQ
ncbi:MAG: ABC transporter permease [Verrucomicrobia bacterium]|nr:ABC transporter permease [Verrucomicrobiota bacterium]